MTTFIIFILFACLCNKITSAYPVDYNETFIEEADLALEEFRTSIIEPNFSTFLNNFQENIVPISLNVYEKISKIHEHYSYRLIEIEENANILNSDYSECLEDKNIPEVEELYSVYENECEKVITDVGKQLISVGQNKQNVFYYKVFTNLMHHYKGCLAPGDPAPQICAGVIGATLEDVHRIIPQIKNYGFETERNLKQELANLAECADGKLADLNKRVHSEFGKVVNCILGSVVKV